MMIWEINYWFVPESRWLYYLNHRNIQKLPRDRQAIFFKIFHFISNLTYWEG